MRMTRPRVAGSTLSASGGTDSSGMGRCKRENGSSAKMVPGIHRLPPGTVFASENGSTLAAKTVPPRKRFFHTFPASKAVITPWYKALRLRPRKEFLVGCHDDPYTG